MLQSRVRAGERDHLITFIQPTIVDGMSNEDKVTGWTTFGEDYARVINRLGTEVVDADQIVHLRQSVFNIGYRRDLKTNMKIIHNDLIWNIMSIAEQGGTRNISLDLICEQDEKVWGLPYDLPFDL